ncbi:ABC transporter ATP-binding protein [Microbacterium sp.]|uniref:ABC transporter ATP-binding protein n=1 Tax=Microbacterium sp. TaxID=51671 RepID=UPI0025EA9AD9|nr:ABC transporter ATP-binding protein [Microbacterium sp.]MBT9607521.1 ABC transporter ATP-binding protein [Microbacterium sp.]
MVVDSAALTVPADGSSGAGRSIRLADVGRTRAGRRVLDGIHLDVAAGGILAVVGESGCGATTLARIIAGHERPDVGEVRIDGRARPDAPRIAGVFDDAAPRFGRVRDAVLARARRRQPSARDEADRLLALVGLSAPDAPVRRLSRGDRQRLALARALVTDPRALVLDDALSALHTSGRERLRDALVRELRRRGTTTIWVTRDTAEAIAVADRVIVLHRGRIAADGTPEKVYARAGEPAVAAVLGPVSTVPGIVEGSVVDVWGQHVPLAESAHDGHCEVVVRPENVVLVAADAPGMDAVVEESTFLGNVRRSRVRTSDGSLVHVDHAAGARLDDHAHVRIALAPVPVATRPLS